MSLETRPVFVHEIKLPEKDDFARKFNQVSELFQEWQDFDKTDASEEEKTEKFNLFFEAKYRLEQGF